MPPGGRKLSGGHNPRRAKMTICRYEVVINLETGVVAGRPLEAYPEPFGKAMCNAMTTAVESSRAATLAGTCATLNPASGPRKCSRRTRSSAGAASLDITPRAAADRPARAARDPSNASSEKIFHTERSIGRLQHMHVEFEPWNLPLMTSLPPWRGTCRLRALRTSRRNKRWPCKRARTSQPMRPAA